jgi:hypothetical protein
MHRCDKHSYFLYLYPATGNKAAYKILIEPSVFQKEDELRLRYLPLRKME